MPEGHTVRRHARRFAAEFEGDKVTVSSPQGRFAAGAALLDGETMTAVDAAGKHLFLGFGLPELRPERWLHVHLGLYGKWGFGPAPAPAPWGQVRVRLETDTGYADLRGATACELLLPPEKKAVIAKLGPDPLRREAGRAERFTAKVGRSRAPIAALLMDQTVIAGIGNVYRAESLFRARMSPDRPGREIAADRVAALWDDLVRLLKDGVQRGTIVTTEPADRPPGTRRGTPPREAAHYVYRRTGEPCRICGQPVHTRELLGRNLYWCPVDQVD